MEKEGVLKREDIILLNHLVRSIEEAELILEESYEKKDYDSFNRAKKFILSAQKKISEILK